ncbi:uncharacterized protein EAE97_006870 [Botrytis byssoidea]|uniref:Uncharacterized protein n=1 Tax=Botrytis byssoidea TaxID=139641 RepID=A0A9P5INJ6_9HELO|nr:uncharacterized protein EAE97_006870 [Botrytis byssoidea]KAF7940684.1 hypothetical protein EAE97_006870 [Botrytis byssoidea]
MAHESNTIHDAQNLEHVNIRRPTYGVRQVRSIHVKHSTLSIDWSMIAPEYATRLPGYTSTTLPSFSKTVSNTARAATDTDWFHQWSNGRDRAGKKLHDKQPMVISRGKMRRDSHIDHNSTTSTSKLHLQFVIHGQIAVTTSIPLISTVPQNSPSNNPIRSQKFLHTNHVIQCKARTDPNNIRC